jgi:hypothetical protein
MLASAGKVDQLVLTVYPNAIYGWGRIDVLAATNLLP